MKIKSSLIIYLCFLSCLLAFSPAVRAAYGPSAYITESVTQDYWWNGSVKGATARTGVVDVSVPNDADVLQYVRVNLTGANMFTGTTLMNSTAYDNVVTSYLGGTDSRDTIYVNTSASSQASSYTINNTDMAPTINLSLSYVNYYGGTDIFDNDNIGPGGSTNVLVFNFTIHNPSATTAINGVVASLQFALDPAGTSGHDAVNIDDATDVTTGGGTTDVVDMDGDTDNDRINWTGNLAAGVTVYITFNASLQETVNIAAGDDDESLDSNDKGGLGNYSSTGALFSGLSVNDKLTRSSIRQGVDMQMSGSTWYAGGLIRNIAAESPGSGEPLTYNITGWRIYSVDPDTGIPYASPNMTGEFNTSGTSYMLTPSDGMIYTNDLARSNNTSWFDTGSSTKPYIAVYFDWYVLWNDTQSEFNFSYINTTMDMQTVHKVDQYYLKELTGVLYPDTGNQPVTVNDTVYYWGSSSISAGNIEIYSIIPVNTTAGDYHGWFTINTSSIKVYFVNASGTCSSGCELEGNSNVNWTATDPTYWAENGTVRVTIADLSSAVIAGSTDLIGRNLSTSAEDRIYLVFDVLSNVSMTTGDAYVFTGNATLNTTSGTYESENVFSPQTMQVSAKRLIGYKDLFIPSPANPTLINATLNVSVQASTGQFIAGIKFLDYVVNGTFGAGADNLSNYIYNLTVRFCNDTGCHTWYNGTDYNVTFNGTVQLTDGTWVTVYEFIKAVDPGTFNLSGGEYIQVDYQMNITIPGSYILPLQIAAFDPMTGESFAAESWGVIRVDIPEPNIPLQITDHALELAKRVVVGTPAVWIKNFEVYNPNPRAVTARFETTAFGDSMEGFASYYNERGEKIEEKVVFGNVENGKKPMSWESSIGPFETRTYEVRVLTPPVMEIDRDVEVLDKLDNRMVKLKMDVFLKSFAEEPYSNLVLNLPLGYENIMEVKDGFGRAMQFTGSKDTSSIIVDQIEPAGMKTISIIYKASYPTIIITPDRDRYDLSAPVSLEILVINGGETIEYPYLEIEIYTPGMDVIYSNLDRLSTMEPLEKTQNYERFVIPANAPGGMYVASAKFREDFTVLASGTGNFLVLGPSVTTPEALQIIAVLSVTLVLVYFSLKRLKEVRRTRSILDGMGPLAISGREEKRL
jgi:hypothetical protein